MKHGYLALALFFILYCIVASTNAWAEPTVTVRSYDNTQYKNPTNKFLPQQKIYIDVRLQGLVPGEHNLNIDWIDPTGKVQAQNHKLFFAPESGNYQKMFFIQLSRLGAFTRMFAGSSYPRSFLGEWTCRFFLDGVKLQDYNFTIR